MPTNPTVPSIPTEENTTQAVIKQIESVVNDLNYADRRKFHYVYGEIKKLLAVQKNNLPAQLALTLVNLECRGKGE